MRVVDLTHLITPDMPVYPGTEGPRFQPANTYERDGFKETLLSFYTHTGTHMDPPAHLFAGRTTLDAFPVSHFVGKAAVIDCTDLQEGGRITMEHVRRNPNAEVAEFLLFRTGWDRYWGKELYFGDYPCITPEVASYITASGKKGVGLDTIGLDPIADVGLTLHRQLLQDHDVVIIENLTGLDQLGSELVIFCALPLKHEQADGSPIRAIAIL